MAGICIDACFLLGYTIEECLATAKEKAIAWDVTYVCFKFNGRTLSIGQSADLEKALNLYMDSFDSDAPINHHIVCK